MTLPYIVNVALILAACLAFYKLLLRRETFYKINRYVLIGCLAVSFALPLLQVPQQFSLRSSGKERTTVVRQQPSLIIKDQPVQNTNNTNPVTQPAPTTNNQTQSAPIRFSFEQLLGWIFLLYWFGVFVFAGSFLLQVVLLLYRARRNPVIVDGKYRIVEVSGNKAPCSFANTIFINPSAYNWETYNQILLHEKIHIRQKHTVDIIIAELVLIFQWFNPFAWIYRREIENNLEFLTDDELMQKKEVDKKSYQLSLLQVSAPHHPLSLTANYNQSILKKRITMMNTKRSNLHTTWKYFFLLPLLAFMACLLNEPVAKSQTPSLKNKPSVKNVQGVPNVQIVANVQNQQQVQNQVNVQQQINMKTAQNVANGTNVRPETDVVIHNGFQNEGYWFAVIKGDKVNIHFSDEKLEDDKMDFSAGRSYSSTTFNLSELGNIPKGSNGTFNISREAGKMEMTGKFDGNTGMGTFKFVADKAYVDYMSKELNEKLDDEDQVAFFFVNVRKGYLQMLKGEGFTGIEKDDLIAMAAMNIDAAYIRSIKNAGFKDVSMEDLISLKALGVDAAYTKEIRDAGYKNITTDQLVSFKAQGIDKAYITKMKQLKGKDGGGDVDADDIVSLKAMNVDEAYINSFKAVGYSNIPHEELVSFKAVGVTPEYIKSWQALGYKHIDPEDLVGMKSQDVTPEYMTSFTSMGYKNVKPEDLVAFKALDITPEYIKSFEAAGYKNIDLDELPALKSLGVTPEYIKSFEAIGYKNIDLDELPALKAQSITPEFIKSFESVGFTNIPLEDIISVKAVGVTPEYIKDMKSKGFNYNSLQKYVTLKSID